MQYVANTQEYNLPNLWLNSGCMGDIQFKVAWLFNQMQ